MVISKPYKGNFCQVKRLIKNLLYYQILISVIYVTLLLILELFRNLIGYGWALPLSAIDWNSGVGRCLSPTFLKSLLARDQVRTKQMKSQCPDCSYVYNEEQGDPYNGILYKTKFEDLPDDWICPECGGVKERFEQMVVL